MSSNVSFALDRIESAKYNKKLYRMKAEDRLNFVYSIAPGTIGGLVESPSNIKDSWIEDGAMIVDHAIVTDCLVRKDVYASNNCTIVGNGNILGGNSGYVTICDSVFLNLKTTLDMGPLTLCGEGITLTGENDIISLCGLFPNKGYNTHITVYKSNGKIYCCWHESDGICELKDLSSALLKAEDDIIFDDKSHLMTFTKHLTSLVKCYFK